MEITELIEHPEQMDRDTLYELRSILALHPYFQTVRLLMLQNLYLLHDPSFDEELRRAAIYVTDRKAIFQMIEAAHYQLRQQLTANSKQQTANSKQQTANSQSNRTIDLIDNFLDSIPQEESDKKSQRKPTPADASVDYVSYLLSTEGSELGTTSAPDMKGQELIDTFLEQEQGRILLNDLPQDTQETVNNENVGEEVEEEYFTETLARIYIKQGHYEKALGIIGRLSERYPKKNAYFADQMRFLEKLIINSKNK